MVESAFLFATELVDLPPFMKEENGPNWRKYYLFRDLQANLIRSGYILPLVLLKKPFESFGITEGAISSIISGALEQEPDALISRFVTHRKRIASDFFSEPCMEYLLEVAKFGQKYAIMCFNAISMIVGAEDYGAVTADSKAIVSKYLPR